MVTASRDARMTSFLSYALVFLVVVVVGEAIVAVLVW
jgi:hypothetical protein